MSQFKFNVETLYSKTDDGLEILKFYLQHCPGFDKAVQNKKNKFKYREGENTESAELNPPGTGIKGKSSKYWTIKDHGGDFLNPMSVAMEKSGMDFYPCLKMLYEQFGLAGSGTFFKAETEVVTLDETDTREPGWFNIVFREEHFDLKIIGKYVTPEIANRYHFKSIDFYEKIFIKKDTGHKTYIKVKSTESFPIFGYAPDDTWCKTYAPLSTDKQYKHGYLGKKPERYVHGLKQIQDFYNEKIAEFNQKIDEAKKNEEQETVYSLTKERNEYKIETVISASGGSDGMNVASLGYFAIWFNSESEQLSPAEYNILKPMVRNLYNLPDVDASGQKYGFEVAEKFWSMKSIWLPKEKLGANGKDFRDWMKFYNHADLEMVQYHFSNLLNTALRAKFFERNAKTKVVKIKPSFLHYFMKIKGFYLYYPEKNVIERTAEQECIFIRIEHNIVRQYFPNQIRKFCERYLIEKGQSTEVIDLVKSSVQFTDKNLLGLDDIVLNFKTYTQTTQTFFFNNLFATVSAEGIDLKPYKDYSNYVWSDKRLQHIIKPEKPFFETVEENGKLRVKILRSDCDYMNFLINASRVFWRKELEEPFSDDGNSDRKNEYFEKNRFNLKGEGLSDDEIYIQEQHFLSKCYWIGYLLHRQKRMSQAKALYIMDDAEKDSEDDANGRSGKSLLLVGVDQMLPNRFRIDGRNNFTQDKHALHGFTAENDYLYFEDLVQHGNALDYIFNWITSAIPVNPKNSKPYDVGFFDAGKIAINANFGISKLTDSLRGRLAFLSTSDYYHIKTDKYNEERKVSSDFGGKDLFSSDWPESQWNYLYCFLMQCNQLFLSNIHREINAPMQNIDVNNMKAAIGDTFNEWARGYFFETFDDTGEDGTPITIHGTLNEYVPRSEMQASYNVAAGSFKKTSTNFKKALNQYCKMHGWILNPKDLLGSDGTIKRPYIDSKNKRQVVEHFYIRTSKEVAQTQQKEALETDLPF